MRANINERFLQEGERKYSFFAFISYKHKDKRWAKWFHRRLESYRLPNRLCREQDMPRYVMPIFRDETDLLAGKTVYERLEENLRASKYLIVICTRNMKESPEYIDFEIEQFLAQGNPVGRILPLIIDSGDPQTRLECFPPALLRMGDNRPLGITIDPTKFGPSARNDAVLMLVASILGIEVQSLKSHDQARRVKRIACGLAAVLAIVTLFAATVAWEMISVKQARLREQNVYAAETYADGDRYRAIAMAENVLQEAGWLTDDAISAEAEKIRTAAFVQPKFEMLTHLAHKTGDSRSMFDREGRHVMIVTGNSVRKYDLSGNLVLQFDSAGLGQRIVDVSSDGRHAVVMSTNGTESTLWLYDMESRKALAQLAASSAHDASDKVRGNFSSVLDAQFSPDGSLCAAWCTGGYYNTNDELPVYSAETGEKLAAVPGSLLGDRDDGGQGAVVESFEFVSNTLLRWSNSHFNVFYSTVNGESGRTSVANMAEYTNAELEVAAERYVVGANESAYLIVDEARQSVSQIATEDGAAVAGSLVYAGKYALLTWGDGSFDRLDIVDLENGQTMASTLGCAEFIQGYRNIKCYASDNSPRLYVCLSKGLRSQWLRFDPENGTCRISEKASTAKFSDESVFLAWADDRDLVISRDGSDTRISEISASGIETYAIDRNFDSFTEFLLLPPVGTSVLLGVEDATYCLFAGENAGVQLDAAMEFDEDAERVHAVSADGRLLLKAQGTKAAVWEENEIRFECTMDYNIHSAAISGDGSRMMLCSADELAVYSADGQCIVSQKSEEGRRYAAAKFSPDGSRILLLDGSSQRYSEEWYSLYLLDAGDLSVISCLSQNVLCGSYAEPQEVFDLSPDCGYAAAVERVFYGNVYTRVVKVWSLRDGAPRASTLGEADFSGTIFDFGKDVSYANALNYACFGDNGVLMAGSSSGVWTFDMQSMQTIGYLPDAEARVALPRTLGQEYIIYPGETIHIWSIRDGALLTSIDAVLAEETFISMDVSSAGSITVSADGQLLIVSDRRCARIFDAASWEEIGRMSNAPTEAIYLGSDSFVYATEEGLFRQTR